MFPVSLKEILSLPSFSFLFPRRITLQVICFCLCEVFVVVVGLGFLS